MTRGCLARIPLALTLVLLVLGGIAPGSGNAATLPAASQSLALLAREVSAYAGPLGPYRNGIWITSNTVCWA